MAHLYQATMSGGRIVCAAVVDERGVIVRAAPYIEQFVGQHIWRLKRWVQRARSGDVRYLGPCQEERS